jgi:hypothetical protein
MMFLIIRQYETNKKLGEALLNCLISVHLDFLAECTCARMLKGTDRKREDGQNSKKGTDRKSEDGQNNTTDGNQQNVTDAHEEHHHHLEKTVEGKHTSYSCTTLILNLNCHGLVAITSLAYLHACAFFFRNLSIQILGLICAPYSS